jgi:hypothetical protein
MTTTKKEAIELFVNRDLNAVPQEWVRKVAEADSGYPSLPMWGTMWIVDTHIGERLIQHSRVMAESKDDIQLDDIEDEAERTKVEKAIKADDWTVLEEYIDEEMAYEHCVLDKDGRPTALFVYEIGDEYVIGVNGAGWNFYDGVWDRLYDLLDLQWHTTEKE